LINTGPRQQQGQAMERFSIRLEARDPARGRFRAYRIDAGTDLLGDWLVDVTYGRIGTRAAPSATSPATRPRPAASSGIACNGVPPPPAALTASPTSSPTWPIPASGSPAPPLAVDKGDHLRLRRQYPPRFAAIRNPHNSIRQGLPAGMANRPDINITLHSSSRMMNDLVPALAALGRGGSCPPGLGRLAGGIRPPGAAAAGWLR
jgi:hypothetical protein